MFSHTEAFATYRQNSQANLDFAVLVCHAAPLAVAAMDSGMLPPKPDHLQKKATSSALLKARAATYEHELARTVLMSVFSYFEAYVRAVLLEIIKFHGGNGSFVALSERRARKFLQTPTASAAANRRKLQDREDPACADKYRKYSRLLQAEGFRFPTELLSPYGARHLVEKASEKNGLRAWEIPDVLEHGLLFPVASSDRARFDAIRKQRNAVAHGGAPKLSLRDSMKTASDLHAFASRVDRHVVEHFLVIEKFA